MRVLFLTPYGAQGGSENVLVNVLERLDRERFDPHVLMLERGGLRERIAELGIPTLVQHLPGKHGVLKILAAARRIPAGFDVIHANGGKAAVYALPLARRLKIPLIWMKHDHSYDGRLTQLLAHRCDHVVCVSHAMASQFEDMGERVSVVYPGVITRDLKPVHETGPTVLSIGRLDPYKGFDQVLEAIAELRADDVEVNV